MTKGEFIILSDGLTEVIMLISKPNSLGVTDKWCIENAIRIMQDELKEIEERQEIERKAASESIEKELKELK